MSRSIPYRKWTQGIAMVLNGHYELPEKTQYLSILTLEVRCTASNCYLLLGLGKSRLFSSLLLEMLLSEPVHLLPVYLFSGAYGHVRLI